MSPFLSLVVPAHDEERRLAGSLERIRAYLDAQPWPSEVLVVENGSGDRTFELASDHAADWPALRVLREAEAGKGRAVRRGMLEAAGEYRFLCDADLSMPIEQVARFLPPTLRDVDVGVGSREAPGARRFSEPAYRHVTGRVFNAVTRWVVPGLDDTQCGFKCFRGPVAEDVFSRQRLDGFSFDVEVLAIALHRGYRVAEVPIDWTFDADSRVRLVRDSLGMARDVWRVRRNLRTGVYAGPAQRT